MIALKIAESQVTDAGHLLITKVALLDTETMEEIRPARITPELEKYLRAVLIDIEKYHDAMRMIEKNPAFGVMIRNFEY